MSLPMYCQGCGWETKTLIHDTGKMLCPECYRRVKAEEKKPDANRL